MLTARNLRHGYGPALVLDGIDLALEAGRVTCLLGPSGCGKSTLLNILAGLLEPREGVVESDVARPGPAVGYMTQDSNLLPWLTAAKNGTLAARLRGDISPPDSATLTAAFQQFGLSGCENQYPQELSGGQQQRVALVRTLLAAPRLLLLDEPLGHLDTVMRLKAAQAIRTYVAAHHATALIVTHQLDEAIYLGDAIITLSEKPTRVLKLYDLNSPAARREAFMALSGVESFLEAVGS